MEFKEKLLGLKDAVIALQSASTLPEEFEVVVAAEKEASEKIGFDKGVASVSAPGDKVFSQADVDAMIAPLNEKISSLQTEYDAYRADAESQKSLAVAAAKAEIVAAIQADFEAAQASENETEAEFKAKLDSKLS